MATTYKLIASSTVGAGGATSITFSSIPNTYTDFKVVFSLRDNTASTPVNNVFTTINGTSTGYSERVLFSDGSVVSSGNRSSTNIAYLYSDSSTATSNTFSSGEIYIPNYTSSNNKSMSIDSASENNATTAYTAITAALWSNSSAITSITLSTGGSNYVQYSSAYLYGIKNS